MAAGFFDSHQFFCEREVGSGFVFGRSRFDEGVYSGFSQIVVGSTIIPTLHSGWNWILVAPPGGLAIC